MHFVTLIAQTGTSVDLNPTSVLIAYGPMGVMLAWFMLRFEKMIDAFKTLSHRIDGITRAMLLDVASRDGVGNHTKNLANEMLARIEARDATKD